MANFFLGHPVQYLAYHTDWLIDWLIDWLAFNGTFSTVRLYRAFRSTYSLRFGKQKHPGSLVHLLFSSGWPATYITPSSRIAYCSQWPLKGWSQLLTYSNGREQKARRRPTEVRHASATTWREMTQLTKVKQNIHQHKDKSCNLKTQKDKLKARPGCMNCFC